MLITELYRTTYTKFLTEAQAAAVVAQIVEDDDEGVYSVEVEPDGRHRIDVRDADGNFILTL